ncbi:L-threonylcarbamoyladenylate synthase [Fodinibius sediminis]|uniref:tRNA threonylcarbamoyl adenosine modification protein, Sua5/YciO/YrdC/YwlC family n=1 Tax=Fodinibius sediminis TaxID=1214077 RepID=A0A521C9T0_9BACT|nr:L-threonylcarbamoyladenylate synthase [Fodinibius sediminis]SMO56156.1 tRNA threonylcarbamoyl adenosine modification protein, Sua5/YciO/YrdC/YwlC family [Fodinibius sediminis]
MAERIKLHPKTPHVKRLFEIADMIKEGAVVLFPTDSQYAIGCDYKNKKGIEQIRKIRKLGKDDHLTILCDSLSGISQFAHISDHNFKLIKRLIPGPYTFILPATKEVPKLLVHPKKKTVGIRVPDYPIAAGLVREVGNPLLAITAKKPEMDKHALDTYEREPFLREFEKLVDVIIDNQQELPSRETSILDMTDDNTKLLRRGLGMDSLEEVFRMQREPLETTS